MKNATAKSTKKIRKEHGELTTKYSPLCPFANTLRSAVKIPFESLFELSSKQCQGCMDAWDCQTNE